MVPDGVTSHEQTAQPEQTATGRTGSSKSEAQGRTSRSAAQGHAYDRADQARVVMPNASAGRFSPRSPLGTLCPLLRGNEFNGSLDTGDIAFDLSDTLFGYIV
jgi:hypothetical protein